MRLANLHVQRRGGRLGDSRRERGAVLMVSLMILLIMTLVSISSVTTSTIEYKLANNSQNQKIAFQAAESALTNMVTTVQDDQTMLLQATSNPVTGVNTNLSGGSTMVEGITATAGLRFLGETVAIGSSLDKFSAFQFDIEGNATVLADNTTSENHQGIRTIVPKL